VLREEVGARGLVLALRDEPVDGGLPAIDALALHGGQHEAQGVTPKRVLGPHRGFEVILEPRLERRGDVYAPRISACAAWLPCACGARRGARRTRGGGLPRGSLPAGS